MTRPVRIGLLVVVLVAVVVIGTRLPSHQGYFSPVFGPAGTDIYFIQRETRGLVTGLGWEFFTPPAHVFVWSDRFSLRRVTLETGVLETLTTFPPSPIDDRRLRTYRGRAFTVPATVLRWTDGRLEIRIRLSIPVQPTSEQHFLTSLWDSERGALVTPPVWSRDWVAMSGDDVSPLSGDLEVIAIRGRESFPCAVVTQHAAAGRIDVLVDNGRCEEAYPNGITTAAVEPLSRRADIERVSELRETHARLLEEALEAGLPEHEAALRVIDQMRDLGFYPQPTRLLAREILGTERATVGADGGPPLFVIQEMQFTVGLFQDLERALDAPGTAVEKTSGRYVIHHDYTTSQALNAFLDGGGTIFQVQRGDRVFEVRVLPGG